ncbi:VSP [Giardia lamblia P15]|uniref:VSP n=1 Tax=Giardia intestinalis (strain P15) TaxID=658858 RepID=E1F7X0_GIAIA|nr:VSP [Giardia lamblia P15]
MFSGFVFVGLIVQLAWTEQVTCTVETETGQCKENMCIAIGADNVCTDCGKAGEVPINGKCVAFNTANDKCKKADNQQLDGTDTTCGKCEGTTFMYKGGCYETTGTPGQTMCKTAADGKCTEAPDSKSYFVIPEANRQPTGQTVVWCGDNAGVTSGGQTYKGVIGCTKCDGSKLTADASGEAVCSACGDNKIVKIAKNLATSCVTEGECTGAEGFFVKGEQDPKTCEACAETCKTCKEADNKCTSCNEGTPYLKKDVGDTGTCVDANGCTSVKTHYIDDTDDPVSGKTCKTCVSGGAVDCETCVKEGDGAICKTCPSAGNTLFGLNKKSCVAQCPDHSEADDDKICKCDSGYMLNETGDGCKEGSAPAPVECPIEGCKTCSTDKKACEECEASKYLTPTKVCVSDCAAIPGYYNGANDGKSACKKCVVENCVVCTGDGTCEMCTDGFFGPSCSQCHETCKTCNGGSESDKCTSCKAGSALAYGSTGSTGTCGAECTTGMGAGKCKECGLTVEGTRYCSRCSEDKEYPQNGVCAKASARTSSCQDTNIAGGVCSTCENGFFRMNGGCYKIDQYPGKAVCAQIESPVGTCEKAADGYKLDAGVLIICPEGCKECANGSACDVCKDGYVKLSGAQTCTKCDTSCKTCKTATTKCVDCSAGYYKTVLEEGACTSCEHSNNGVTGVANCASCAPPSNNQGSVLCYLMKDGGSTNKGGLSTGAIAGIVVAVVIVVGGLVGFLCWWFMCRGKA